MQFIKIVLAILVVPSALISGQAVSRSAVISFFITLVGLIGFLTAKTMHEPSLPVYVGDAGVILLILILLFKRTGLKDLWNQLLGRALPDGLPRDRRAFKEPEDKPGPRGPAGFN